MGLPPEQGPRNSWKNPEQEPQAGNFSRILWDEAQSQTGNDWEGQKWGKKGERIFQGGFLDDFPPKIWGFPEGESQNLHHKNWKSSKVGESQIRHPKNQESQK